MHIYVCYVSIRHLSSTPAALSVSPEVPSPKTGAKKTWEDGGDRTHWYWAAGLLLGDWQLKVTLVPTWGTPRRRQDGGAGGTGGGETGYKNSHSGASGSPPPLPHTDPRHSVCPSPNLHTQSLGGETCPTSHG